MRLAEERSSACSSSHKAIAGMKFRALVNRVIAPTGYSVEKVPTGAPVYDEDGLWTVHNHDFMQDASFRKAYARGAQGAKLHAWHWRVHIGLWAASCAAKLDGDFVECGVNRGFLSSAIMDYLNWNSLNKTFYLLDTFAGIDERLLSAEEREAGALERNEQHLKLGFYVSGVDAVRANFAEWQNVRIIQGTVPDTLGNIDSQKIAYLHLDMNCAEPEVAAFEYLWDRLTPGAFVLLDDYAYKGYGAQKTAMDAAAETRDVGIASLPTGQGLLIKPC
jgi:hypothetical protein